MSVFAASGCSSFCSFEGVGVKSGVPLALTVVQSGDPPQTGGKKAGSEIYHPKTPEILEKKHEMGKHPQNRTPGFVSLVQRFLLEGL